MIYRCSHCAQQTPHWRAVCSKCGRWNTSAKADADFQATAIPVRMRQPQTFFPTAAAAFAAHRTILPTALRERIEDPTRHVPRSRPLRDVSEIMLDRIPSGIPPLDEVLGWSEKDGNKVQGAAPQSVILLCGDPGVGKSTLLLWAASAQARTLNRPALYVTGEETEEQAAHRARTRVGADGDLRLLACQDVTEVLNEARALDAGVVVADSIQTLSADNAPLGTVSTIKTVVARLCELAKSENGPIVWIVGHVTKDGNAAGPQTLAHLVDVCLFFSGEKDEDGRIVGEERTLYVDGKNRFGSTLAQGFFLMRDDGLVVDEREDDDDE